MKKTLSTLLIPSITMLLVSLISFYSKNINLKALFVLGLLVLFPLTFFIQGILSSKFKLNTFIPLLISLFTYLLILNFFMNKSAIIYIFFYSLLFFLGNLLAGKYYKTYKS